MTNVRLRHIAQINPPSPLFDRLSSEDEVTFLPMEAVWPGDRLDLSRERKKAAVATGFTRFENGDVLVPKITPTFEAGRSVLVDNLRNGVGTGTTELHVLRAGAEIDNRFLLYVVNTHSFLKLGEAEMYGVAGQQRVPDRFLRDLRVSLPSLEEQRRIADFLDVETSRIDRLVGLRKRQISLLRERFSAALRDLIGGAGRNASNGTSIIDWFGAIDQTWSTSTIGRLSRTYMGTTFPHAYQGNSCGDYPVIKVSDFRLANNWLQLGNAENWVSKEVAGKLGARIVPIGSILYARVGAALLLNRRVVTTRESIIDDNVRAIHFRSGCATYWANLLTLLDLGELANPGPVPSVSESQVATVRVPIPSVAEQIEIGHQIDSYRRSFCSLESVIDKQLRFLGERRQSLITAAVTGQFDVTTASGRNLTQGV